MAPQEIAALVRSTWQETLPEFRVQALQRQRALLPAALWSQFDACVDLIFAGVHDSVDATTIVLVHGIRTDGKWQQVVKDQLKDLPNLNVVPTGYGFFSALGLIGPFRRRPLEKIRRALRQIRRDEPSTRLIVIAHSFGSYITSKILRDDPDIQFNRVILCGSIVSPGFRWDTVPFDKLETPILNDVGTRDWYPALATAITLGYGPSGCFGFQNARVRDRFFNYGHSDFFTPEHIKTYWRPFVERGEIVDSPWDSTRPTAPYLMMLVSWFPAMLIVTLTGLAAIVFYWMHR